MIGAIPGSAPRRVVTEEEALPEADEGMIPDGLTLPEDFQIDMGQDAAIEGSINGNNIRIDREGLRIDPDAETQRRLDQIDRRREQIQRAVDAAGRQADAQARGVGNGEGAEPQR